MGRLCCSGVTPASGACSFFPYSRLVAFSSGVVALWASTTPLSPLRSGDQCRLSLRGRPQNTCADHHFLTVLNARRHQMLLTLFSLFSTQTKWPSLPICGRRWGSPRRFVRCRLTYARYKLIGKQCIILIIKACFHFNLPVVASIWLSRLNSVPSLNFSSWCDPRLQQPAVFRLFAPVYGSDIAFRQGKEQIDRMRLVITTIPVVSPLEIWLPTSTC